MTTGKQPRQGARPYQAAETAPGMYEELQDIETKVRQLVDTLHHLRYSQRQLQLENKILRAEQKALRAEIGELTLIFSNLQGALALQGREEPESSSGVFKVLDQYLPSLEQRMQRIQDADRDDV
ncbi:MAG: hypothetical protein RLY31_1324 [Bacteroidota bacterium]|jgi:ABC-type phosphate transport system auxiliary subunit